MLLFLVWLGLADFRRTSTYMCGGRAGLENIMAKLMGLHGSSECMSLRTCVRQAFNFKDINANVRRLDQLACVKLPGT